MRLFKITLSLVFTFGFFTVMAQPGGPPATPIDGGLSLLLAAGGIYGLKKISNKKK